MIRITISFIIIGLIVFTSMATFDYGVYSEYWGRAYSIWDKLGYCLLGWCVIKPNGKQGNKEMIPLFVFFLVRLSWDCISWVTGYSVNNPIAVGILFITYLIYVGYKTLVSNVRN